MVRRNAMPQRGKLRKKSHRHAATPRKPCMLSRIAEAISAPKALLIIAPLKKIAFRKPSSSCLYHRLIRKRAPGKKEDSTTPSRKRVIAAWKKLFIHARQHCLAYRPSVTYFVTNPR